ncbi:hypothetical protein SRHO_G00027930 [Serrasalmus rhombeus]
MIHSLLQDPHVQLPIPPPKGGCINGNCGLYHHVVRVPPRYNLCGYMPLYYYASGRETGGASLPVSGRKPRAGLLASAGEEVARRLLPQWAPSLPSPTPWHKLKLVLGRSGPDVPPRRNSCNGGGFCSLWPDGPALGSPCTR